MPAILRNISMSQADRETTLCLDLATFDAGHTTVSIGGKPFRWDIAIESRSPQFLPALPGFWQDHVLVNIDTLAGVVAREDLSEIAGGFQFSHGTTTYMLSLRLAAEVEQETKKGSAKKGGV